MSIVAYYARLNAAQIEQFSSDPSTLESGAEPGIEIIDVDRAYEPVAWLLSERKRAEQAHWAMLMRDMEARETVRPSFLARIARRFQKKQAFQPSAALDAKAAAAEAIEMDSLVVAIEGRSENRDERFELGLDPPAVFTPDEVAMLSSALQAVQPAALEQQFNPSLMDDMSVFPQHWQEEGRELMDTYVIPAFVRLQAFYRDAHAEGQHVLVWYE